MSQLPVTMATAILSNFRIRKLNDPIFFFFFRNAMLEFNKFARTLTYGTSYLETPRLLIMFLIYFRNQYGPLYESIDMQ